MGEIKRRSEACGVSLKKLARQAGVAPSNCYRAVRERSDPRGSTLRRLTEKLLQIEEERRQELGPPRDQPHQVRQ
jgi:predicted transcriptional regulator